MVSGAYLLTRINLNFVENLCHQINVNLELTIKSFRNLIDSEIIKKFKDDRGFTRRIGFYTLGIENTYNQILSIIENNQMCTEQILVEVEDKYSSLQIHLNEVWKIIKTSETNSNTAITQAFIENRPELTVPKPTVSIFLGVGIALATAAISGGIIATLFSGNDQDIDKINNELHRVDKKVLLTNKRIDIMAERVTKSLQDIKVILNNMQTLNEGTEERQMLTWNLSQLQIASANTILLLKIIDNTLTCLLYTSPSPRDKRQSRMPSSA